MSKCGHPEKGLTCGSERNLPSRSVEKRVALQKGEPMPTFGAASSEALSAENIKLKIGSRFYDREPYSGAWDKDDGSEGDEALHWAASRIRLLGESK